MTEEQIIRLYGERCAEHCDDCCVCEVWAMHDLIETQAREIERLNAILSAMNDTDVIARTMAENERLREALGEICTDSNPDWTEKRVYPEQALDDIHTIAVNAYYKVRTV